jgi:hypothetical protein
MFPESRIEPFCALATKPTIANNAIKVNFFMCNS